MKKKRVKRTKLQIDQLRQIFSSSQDPNGSYTGNATDGGKVVQDADDL